MVKSQLNYFSLGESLERMLCIAYNNQLTNFKALLLNHSEIIIHLRNLQILMTAIYEIIKHTAPPIMSSLFEMRDNKHNARHFQVFSNESRGIVKYGLETLCYKAPFLWQSYCQNISLQIL